MYPKGNIPISVILTQIDRHVQDFEKANPDLFARGHIHFDQYFKPIKEYTNEDFFEGIQSNKIYLSEVPEYVKTQVTQLAAGIETHIEVAREI